MFETLSFDDLDEGFRFTIGFRPVGRDQMMVNAFLRQ